MTSNGVGYDPRKLYTRASDGRGHNELIHVPISPALAAVIREVVEKVPDFKSKADVVRNALVHSLHDIARWAPDNINLQPLQWELAQQGIDYTLQCQKDWDALIDSSEKLLNSLLNQGDYETAEIQLGVLESLQDMSAPYLLRLGAVCQHARARMRGYKTEDTGKHD